MLLIPSLSLGSFFVLPRLLTCRVILRQRFHTSACKARTESHIRNFLCAILFWILRLSSGSDTSVQSSDLGDLDFDFDGPDEECLLELGFAPAFVA